MDMINGFIILTNPLICKRALYKNCRSKKRRIIKKWRKNPKNYKSIPDNNIYRMPGNKLIMHPVMKERLLREITSHRLIEAGMVDK